MNNLVYGGTPDIHGNRMIENILFCTLEFVPECIEVEVEAKINSCESVKDLAEVMKELDFHDINIVGTRGYIYQSKAMASSIDFIKGLSEDINIVWHWQSQVNLLTRTLGLRGKFINLMGGLTGE